MPIIVGEHDFGPSFASVYMVEKICDAHEATSKALAQRSADTGAQAARITEEFVQNFRERRKALQDWPFYRNPFRRRRYIDLISAHEALILKISGVSVDRPSWKMSDGGFDAFVARFRAARAAM